VYVVEKRIGFLSFGHWQPIPGSQVRTGRDALVQSVELAVAAEELGVDGAVREADTLLITVPNMLGVEYNARLLENVLRHVAPAIGWQRAA
jgi:hypothetical protein